jgi:hypothetical protein
MTNLSVRLSRSLAADLERESRRRGVSKSDFVRDCIERTLATQKPPASFAQIAHLVGSVDDDLPPDVSARVDHYLRKTGFGRDRRR